MIPELAFFLEGWNLDIEGLWANASLHTGFMNQTDYDGYV